MTVVSNGQFWLYTCVLVMFWIIVLTTASNDGNRVKHKISLPQANPEDDLKYTGICKNLCKLCGCLGFYCGEECICECNDDHADTDCIRQMQISAQSSNIPFEILIQGPRANKFVRNALLYEQNQEKTSHECHKKRLTVTVYKPNKADINMQKYSCDRKTAFKDVFKATDISKRRNRRSSGNNNFEWFSNLGSNLLRPAPLGGRKPQVEETRKPTTRATTSPSILGKSWIFDSFDNILTPKPLKKRKNSQIRRENEAVSSSNHASNEAKYDDPDDGKTDINRSEETKYAKLNKQTSFSPDEANLRKSKETLIDTLSQFFKNNKFEETDDTEDEKFKKRQEEPLQSSLHKDELSYIENDQTDLFADEVEEEKRTKNKGQENKNSNLPKSQNYLSTLQNDFPKAQKLFPINIRRGLQEFRAPWFKPGKLLQKFREVISS